MFEELFPVFYQYLFPLTGIILSTFGIYAAILLKGRTRNWGPHLILVGNILQILINLTNLMSSFWLSFFVNNYDVIQKFYLALNLSYLMSYSLTVTGLVMVAKDFRAFLEAKILEAAIRPH